MSNEENEIEFELTDIFEDVNVQNIKQVITRNIKYLLKREHKTSHVFYPRGYSVVIPEGGYTYQLENKAETGSFEGDFEIFKNHKEIAEYGHVLGTISAEQLLDITVWLKKREVSIEWLYRSRHPFAKKFREVYGKIPIELRPIEYYQQIVDNIGLPLKITSLKKLPSEVY